MMQNRKSEPIESDSNSEKHQDDYDEDEENDGVAVRKQSSIKMKNMKHDQDVFDGFTSRRLIRYDDDNSLDENSDGKQSSEDTNLYY